MTGSDAPPDACNRFTARAGSCTVLKRSGAEEDVNAAKAVRGMVAAGCPKAVAEEIAAGIPTNSTEAIKDYITAELLRRDETAAAERYKSYRAGFTSASIKVLQSRYLMRDPDGQTTETPVELFWRVAACMALPVLGGVTPPDSVHGYRLTKHHLEPYADFRVRSLPKRWSNKAEAHRHFVDTVERYQRIMFERRFLPNSPTIMNAGGPLGQLSACFVLDMPDTLPAIMDGIKDATLIFKSGGVGINYSSIRPAGSPVASTAGAASGQVSFMSIMDRSSEVVKQGGKRRAANMGVLDASHPDIERFISAKREGSALNTFNEVEEISLRSEADPAIMDYLIATHEGPALNNFNISVGTDAEFWKAAAGGEDYHGKNAAALLDKIAESAHDSAEPGVIFFDNINRHNMLEKARGGPLRSTNPCWGGETKVLTKNGPVSFRELANGPSQVKVLSREDDGSLSYRTMQNPGITAENADVVCLVVASKKSGECAALRCTPSHKVYVMAGPNIERRAVETLTPGTSLASLYLEGSIWEQSNGVSTPANEVPEIAMEGTGHPRPSVLPLKLGIRGKGKGKGRKKVMADGFATPDGDIPEVQSEEKPKGLSRFFRRNHKVLAVIHLGRTDVYNGMVDGTHNYFVACGEDHYILSGNCGEQALYSNESCNLGSINLAEYVDGDALDWDRLAGDTRLCTRMLDGVVSMTRHPTSSIGLASNETRRVGLGVMGVADMLMYLGIAYNSKEAYKMFGRLAEFISYHSMDESVRMAAERGPFPLYSESAYVEGRLPAALNHITSGSTTPRCLGTNWPRASSSTACATS